jgi:CitMHS family citrate-Mg2+:H+ or citrate-Ca2+:H+ symporter
MLMFAILYFALMIDSGLFDPAVRKILKLVKGDPLKVSVGTAVLALVVSLDGDGATTYMICCAAMLPLYSRLGMSPRIMAGLIILAGGVMNMTPWGGPTARAASALHVDPSDIFVPMIPAMAAGVLAILAIAYMYGKRERARLGELHLPTDDIDHSEISVSHPDARRPKLIWFNGALTAALMVALIAGVLPLPVLFMIAFSIAMIVNYPCLQQKDRIAAHAGSVLAVTGLIFAAGIFTGILSGTGMVDAMSKSLLAVIPEARPLPGGDHRDGEHAVHLLHVQRRVLLRRAAGAVRAASHYGITPVEMARASIVGQPVHLLSPLVPSTYLLVALAGIEFGDHQRFTLKWAVLVCLCIMFGALLMGIFRCSAVCNTHDHHATRPDRARCHYRSKEYTWNG